MLRAALLHAMMPLCYFRRHFRLPATLFATSRLRHYDFSLRHYYDYAPATPIIALTYDACRQRERYATSAHVDYCYSARRWRGV